MKGIVVSSFGPSDALKFVERPSPTGEVLVTMAWAGVNFVDLYQREGRYPGVTLPFVPGLEGSGIVAAAPAESEWRVGDRVAFSTGVQGSYAGTVAAPARHLVRVPQSVSLREASAALEQGLTAMVLADDVARLRAGSTLLVHAAAGGVGGWLVQLLKARGHRVIGTASSQKKLAWLTGLGVEAIGYGDSNDWAKDVERLTEGAGVDVVFDSVGRATFLSSLRVLAPCGHLVLFGAASGQPDPVDVVSLMTKSVTLTRPVMPHYLPDAESLRRKATAVFDAVSTHAVELRIHREYELASAADAHTDLASRNTTGKLMLSIAPELI